MNCQEVMELMQRQLDDDLDENEKEVLMNHTRQCPDCAAMFERLQLLSAELTSLPKVMPSYSLVDAIMPQLERMELYGKTNAPAEQVNGIQTTTETVPRRVKRQRRWPSIRIMSGVIAAGIVAGLFLVTNQPGSMPDLSSISKYSLKSQNSATADSQEQAPSELSFTVAETGNRAVNPEVSTEALKEDGKVPKNHAKDAAPAPKDEKSSSMNTQPTSGGTEQPTDKNLVGGSGLMASEDSFNPEENELDNKADASSFQSPDSKYNAKAEAFTIKLYALKDDTLVYTSPRKNGQLTNLSWSEDSAKLTYEVQVEQGAIEKYVIDVATLTEQKAAH